MKAKIFVTSALAQASIEEVEVELGIPNNEATTYSKVVEINNPDSEYDGKFTFPVLTAGRWKCDQFFDPSDLIEWDSEWFVPDE